MQINDWKFNKDHVKSWAEEGKKAGAFVRDAVITAEQSVMTMLLTIAGIIAGTPSQEDFLTGYASAWANKDTGKSRKSDARAVFEAYALKQDADKGEIGDRPIELIVGYEKDEKGDNKKDKDGNAIPIKVTKSAKDWLLEYDPKEGHGSQDGFKGFLSLARLLRNSGDSSRQSQGTSVSRRTKVTDTQFGGIVDSIPVMSATQAHKTVTEAAKVLAKLPNFEKVMVAEMQMLCNQLKTSKIALYQEFGAKLLDQLDELNAKVVHMEVAQRNALQNTSSKTAGTVEADFQAPAPAQQKEEKVA